MFFDPTDIGTSFKHMSSLPMYAAIFAVLLSLQACGQKGDLYLPVTNVEESEGSLSQQLNNLDKKVDKNADKKKSEVNNGE